MIDLGFITFKFALIFFRVLSILFFVPIFSSRTISIMFKAAFSLIVSIAIADNVQFDIEGNDVSWIFGAILKEILIGAAIGFVIRIVFCAVLAAGDVISVQTGLSFVRFMDPSIASHISVIEGFKNILAMIVFFSVDAHHILIRSLILSFDQVPCGFSFLNSKAFIFFIELTGRIFVLGLKIGAPVIVTLFLVEFALALLARMVPQMNIFIEGLPLKILIAIFVLSFSLSLSVPYIGRLFLSVEKDVIRFLRVI